MNPASPTCFAGVLTPPPYSCPSQTSPGPEISPVSPGQPLCFCSLNHACNYSRRAHLAWEVCIPAPGTVSYCSCLYTISGVPSHDSRQDPGPGVDSGPLYSPTHLYGTGAVGGGEMVRREGPVKSVSSVIVRWGNGTSLLDLPKYHKLDGLDKLLSHSSGPRKPRSECPWLWFLARL